MNHASSIYKTEPDRNEAIPMNNLLTKATLKKENQAFRGTAGVSENNRCARFRPAFHDLATARTVQARFADGRPAPMHLLDGLPREWVAEYDAAGRVRAIKDSVIAGFVRDGIFYTREQAAAAALH
jgi:hypothetical protein